MICMCKHLMWLWLEIQDWRRHCKIWVAVQVTLQLASIAHRVVGHSQVMLGHGSVVVSTYPFTWSLLPNIESCCSRGMPWPGPPLPSISSYYPRSSIIFNSPFLLSFNWPMVLDLLYFITCTLIKPCVRVCFEAKSYKLSYHLGANNLMPLGQSIHSYRRVV
jgi:hypothetical protein